MIRIGCSFPVLRFSLLTGCGGSEDNSEPPSQLTEFDATNNLSEQGSLRTHGSVEQQFLFIEPLLLKDKIVVAGRDGLVTVTDFVTGEQIQDVDLDTTLSSGVGGDSAIWLLSTKDGDVIWLDALTKHGKRMVNIPSDVFSRSGIV